MIKIDVAGYGSQISLNKMRETTHDEVLSTFPPSTPVGISSRAIIPSIEIGFSISPRFNDLDSESINIFHGYIRMGSCNNQPNIGSLYGGKPDKLFKVDVNLLLSKLSMAPRPDLESSVWVPNPHLSDVRDSKHYSEKFIHQPKLRDASIINMDVKS